MIYGNIIVTSSSLNLPELQILSKSSPPAAYSITIAKCVAVNKTYFFHNKYVIYGELILD